MIFGKLRRLGYASVGREAHPTFNRYKEARDKADGELLAILEEVGRQTGRPGPLPAQQEPSGQAAELAPVETWLDLKRLAAHLEEDSLPQGPRAGPDPSADPALSPYLCGEKRAALLPHLLHHAEASGFFVPLDFGRPFWLAEEGRSVGSAPGLLSELLALEKELQTRPGEFAAERELLGRLVALCQEACKLGLTIQLSTSAFCFE